MKLNIKKTGLVIVASSAFMVASAQAEVDVYGKFGMELHNTTTKANKDADSVGGLSFMDGGVRLGLKGEKDFDGGTVAFNLEYGNALNADTGGLGFAGRFANVQIKLDNGGTLGLGQQNNLGVASGWFANAWNYQASSLMEDASNNVNGNRYTGVKYSHSLGMATVAIMLGIDSSKDTDDGAKGTTPSITEKAVNMIDKISFLVTAKPMEALGVQLAYAMKEGDKKNNPAKANQFSVAVTYDQGPIGAAFGFAQKSETALNNVESADKSRTSMSLNAKYALGSITPYFGVRMDSYDNKSGGNDDLDKNDVVNVGANLNADNEVVVAGDKNDRTSQSETAISLGVNFSALGGAGFAAIDNISNRDGVEGKELTRIHTGLSYSF